MCCSIRNSWSFPLNDLPHFLCHLNLKNKMGFFYCSCLFLVCMCPGICVHMCQDAHVKITGQHVGIVFFFSSCGPGERNLGHQGWQEVPIPAEPSPRSPLHFLSQSISLAWNWFPSESLGSIYLCLIKGRCLIISVHHHIWYYNFLYLFLIYTIKLMCKSFACVYV